MLKYCLAKRERERELFVLSYSLLVSKIKVSKIKEREICFLSLVLLTTKRDFRQRCAIKQDFALGSLLHTPRTDKSKSCCSIENRI